MFLAVLKPDGVLRRAAGAGILKGLADAGLCKFLSFKKILVPQSLLEEHYKQGCHRIFYPWLLKYMSSYPSYVIFVEAEAGKIDQIRRLLGATRAHEAEKNSLRYNFCPYGGVNGLHLSKDEKSGEVETKLWKRTLNISNGQFDLPVQDYIDENINFPNKTSELREIFLGVDKGNSRLTSEEGRIKELLAQESVNSSADEIEFLYWVYADQFKLD